MVFGSLALHARSTAGARNRSGLQKTSTAPVRNELMYGRQSPSAYQAARTGLAASSALKLYRAVWTEHTTQAAARRPWRARAPQTRLRARPRRWNTATGANAPLSLARGLFAALADFAPLRRRAGQQRVDVALDVALEGRLERSQQEAEPHVQVDVVRSHVHVAVHPAAVEVQGVVLPLGNESTPWRVRRRPSARPSSLLDRQVVLALVLISDIGSFLSSLAAAIVPDVRFSRHGGRLPASASRGCASPAAPSLRGWRACSRRCAASSRRSPVRAGRIQLRLVLEHVEPAAASLPSRQRPDQRRVVDHAARARLTNTAGLHQRQLRRAIR